MDNNEIVNLVNNELAGLGYLTDFEDYSLIYINNILAKKLNVTDDSYKNKKCYEFIYGHTKPCEHCKKTYLSFDNYYNWYFHNQKLDLYFSRKEKLIKLEGKTVQVVASLDITNEIRQEEELLKLSTVDEGIINCVKKLINEKDTEYAISSLLEMICNFYSGCRSYIFEIDFENKLKYCTFDYVVEGLPHLTDVASKLEFDIDSTWNKLLHQQPYFYTTNIDSFFKDDEYNRDILNGNGVTSLLIVPIRRMGEIAGYIGVDNPDKYDNNYELLGTIAAFILNIIDRQRDLTELKSNKNRLENTFQIGETLIDCVKSLLDDTNDADESINTLLKTISSYYDSECAYIFEWDKETKVVSNTYEYVLKNNSCVNDLYYISHEIIDDWFYSMETKKKLLILSCNEDLDHSSEQYLLLTSSGIDSLVMVPLYRDNKIIGALGVDNLSQNIDNTDLLHTLSGFIINYIQKRELMKELEFLSYTDKLTGLFNRNRYLNEIEQIKSKPITKLGIIFADVNGLKKSNDKLGHEFGDILLKWCANFLKTNLEYPMYRIGGDEFVAFLPDISEYDFDIAVNDIRKTIKKMPHINMSIGSKWSENNIDIENQIIETDKNMYFEKQHYYDLLSKLNYTPEEELDNLKNAILELKKSLEAQGLL